MNSFEQTLEFVKPQPEPLQWPEISRPDGGSHRPHFWEEKPPRPRDEPKPVPRGRAAEQLVCVEVLRAHSHAGRWREIGERYETSADLARDRDRAGYVRWVAPVTSRKWCEPGKQAQPEAPVDPDARGWERMVELEAIRPGGKAGRHIITRLGERWSDNLWEAAKAVASDRAVILSALNPREASYVHRVRTDPQASF
jgi:hypothetical protein